LVSHYLGCRGAAEVNRLDAVEPLLIEKTGIAEWIGP
jgi:hypothetical protein